MLGASARGTEITGRILEAIAGKQGLPGSGRYLVILGRVLWGLVEISVPRSLPSLLARYWLSLLLLIAIVLIVAGLFGAPGVTAVGWSLLALGLATEIVRLTLSRFLLGRRWLRLLILLQVALGAFGPGARGGYCRSRQATAKELHAGVSSPRCASFIGPVAA